MREAQDHGVTCAEALISRGRLVGGREMAQHPPPRGARSRLLSAALVLGLLLCAIAVVVRRTARGGFTATASERLYDTGTEPPTSATADGFVPTNPGPSISPLVARGLVLLTSASVPQNQSTGDHVDEIYAAIATNLLNKFITEVHLLTESDCLSVKQRLLKQVRKMPDGSAIRGQMASKLSCKSTKRESPPCYSDFFRYANVTLVEKMVLLSSPDVVFDETLRLIDPYSAMQHENGYVLSVMPPPHNGQYKKVFNSECDAAPRCAVGAWQGGGSWGQGHGSGNSWDSFVFAPPLSHRMDLSHIDLPMASPGAKNQAAFQLEVFSNLTLYNPCFHVHAYHWHCLDSSHVRAAGPSRSTKEHSDPGESPRHQWNKVERIFPCWSCPGVDMPKGAVKQADYCSEGHLLGAEENPTLQLNFRYPWISGGVCCKSLAICDKLMVESLPHCMNATDVDCVTWEFMAEHRYYS